MASSEEASRVARAFVEEELMEEGVYLNASQRAIIAARMANRPGPFVSRIISVK
jgi:hypothetical protein